MFKDLIESLANRFMGRMVTKLVTVLATTMVAHKLMTPAQQGSWIAANADWLTGLALAGVSMWLSSWQHGKQQEAVAVAAYSPAPLGPPTAAVAAKVEAAAQVLAGGGVGAGNTQIGRTNQNN